MARTTQKNETALQNFKKLQKELEDMKAKYQTAQDLIASKNNTISSLEQQLKRCSEERDEHHNNAKKYHKMLNPSTVGEAEKSINNILSSIPSVEQMIFTLSRVKNSVQFGIENTAKEIEDSINSAYTRKSAVNHIKESFAKYLG